MERNIGVTVNSFNSENIQFLIDNSPKELQEYIHAQKRALDGYKDLVSDSVVIVKSLTKDNKEMMEVLKSVDKYFVDLQNKCALTNQDETAWKKVSEILNKNS